MALKRKPHEIRAVHGNQSSWIVFGSWKYGNSRVRRLAARDVCSSDIVTLWFDCADAWKRWIIRAGVAERWRAERSLNIPRNEISRKFHPRLHTYSRFNSWINEKRNHESFNVSPRFDLWFLNFCAAQCLTHLCLIAQSRLRLRRNLSQARSTFRGFNWPEIVLKPFGSQRSRDFVAQSVVEVLISEALRNKVLVSLRSKQKLKFMN